jgi:hypothetical protein
MLLSVIIPAIVPFVHRVPLLVRLMPFEVLAGAVPAGEPDEKSQ